MWRTLFTLFDSYGPIPRLLFDLFLPAHHYRTGMVEDGAEKDDENLKNRIEEYRDELKGKIRTAVTLHPDIVLPTEYGVNSSHTIYTMRPSKSKMYQYVSTRPVYGLATARIGRMIAEETIAISLKDAQRLYDFLLGQGATKTSAGWVFEARMHQIFQRGGPFKATNLGRSKTIAVHIDHKSCKDFSRVSELGSLLRKEPGSRSINPDIIGRYFKPQRCNLPSVDSFVIAECATTGGPVLVLFQMTVSTEHPVKTEGLASIWAVIPEDLRGTPPILVFVVPAANKDGFKRQSISGSANQTSASRRSASNPPDFETWKQYVLPVSDNTLWESDM